MSHWLSVISLSVYKIRMKVASILTIWDTYQLVNFFFLIIFFPSRPVNVKWEIFSMIANYYHWYYRQLFLLHYHCFSINVAVYSKIWGRLVCSCSEYSQYHNGLGFMEIMQLTHIASWLPGFLYIQVLLGTFQMNS